MNVAEAITRIENELSIIDLIGHYSELTPKGKNYTGKCPFLQIKEVIYSFEKEKYIQVFPMWYRWKSYSFYNGIRKY